MRSKGGKTKLVRESQQLDGKSTYRLAKLFQMHSGKTKQTISRLTIKHGLPVNKTIWEKFIEKNLNRSNLKKTIVCTLT